MWVGIWYVVWGVLVWFGVFWCGLVWFGVFQWTAYLSPFLFSVNRNTGLITSKQNDRFYVFSTGKL